MSTIYSAQIWRASMYSAGSETYTLPTDHSIYVIRDIDVETGEAFNGYLQGFRIVLNGGALFTLGLGFSEPGRTFHWRGRSTAPGGSVLTVYNNDANYLAWGISGYAFV